MTPCRAITLCYRYLGATVGTLVLAAFADTYWTLPTLAQTLLYCPTFYCAARFCRWRGWITGHHEGAYTSTTALVTEAHQREQTPTGDDK